MTNLGELHRKSTMTAFSGNISPIQEEIYMRRIKELQRAIQENGRKLEEIQQKRLWAEEEIIQSKRETARRVELMMEKSEVVDALQQLGLLIEEEKHLSEELSGQAAMDRSQIDGLQERRASATNKASSLSDEIVAVKQRLAEIEACNMAAQSGIPVPTSKSKRRQKKQ